MRVVSLLPAATEIVAALGCADALVGVSHECDHPPEVNRIPRVTHCEIHGGHLPSAAADRWVTETLATTGTLYTLDESLVRALRPDVILTQRLCDVCAVSYGSVAAFAETLPGPPRLASLEPSSVADIFRDVQTVAELLGVPERAVMDVMGWSNSAMVKRYAHVTARLRRDIADRLNSFFWTGK